MRGRIPESVIQQILDRVNLVELVGQQVKLRKTGNNHVGLCPFHSDGKPSFSVNPDKGFYYCFGCHEGGNSISYMMKARGMGYLEAIEHLASLAGVDLVFEEGDRESWNQARELRRNLHAVNREANAYFRSTLTTPEGEAGRRYLQERGISRELASQFQVGFCPSGSGLYDSLVRKGVPLNLASDLGLLAQRAGGRTVDRLGSRVIFPVLTAADDVAGFSGRTIPGGPDPKYLNSPESEIFKKSELLFGLVQAREAMKKRDACLLVEGQLDVLALHQAGFANAVAPLGTALTEGQAAMMRRFTTNIVVTFDGDEAGRKATWRAMTVLLSAGLYGSVVTMPDGEDPDSILVSGGAEALERLVETAVPFLEFAVDTIVRQAGTTLHGRSEAARAAMEFAGSIKQEIDRQVFLERVATELSLSPESLRVQAARRPVDRGPESEGCEPIDLGAGEKSLVEAVLLRPDLARQVCQEDVLELLPNESVRSMLLGVLDEYEEFGEVKPHEIVDRLTDPTLKDLCAAILMSDDQKDPVTIEKTVAELIPRMQRKSLRRQVDHVRSRTRKLGAAGDMDEQFALAHELEQLMSELRRLDQARR